MIHKLGQSHLAWLVFLVGMVLTGLAWRTVSVWEEKTAHHEFVLHTKDSVYAVQQRLDAYSATLHGARGLFAASAEVTRDEWRRYTAASGLGGHHPGVHTFAFIRYVAPHEKVDFEQRVRNDASINIVGYSNFAIFPPGKRDGYYPIEFIEPENTNLHLIGMDRGAEPDTRKTLERARDSGQLAASGHSHGAEQPGEARYFLMVLPIYRNGDHPSSVAARRATLFGFVTARIELASLLKEVVGFGALEELFFELYDGGSFAEKTLEMTRENLLYAVDGSNNLRAQAAKAGRFTLQTGIDVGGRNWRFFFGSRAGGAVGGYLPVVVLLGGVVTSTLMFALVLMLVTQRRRVMAEAVRQKSLFSQVLDALPVNVFLKDKDFRFVLINEESARTLGIAKEAAVGKTNFDVFAFEVAARLLEYDKQVFAVERLVTREECVVINGQEITLFAGKKIIRLPGSSEPMLLGFSVDIGERKKAERELEQQQRFVRQVIDNIPSIVFVKDADGIVLLINQAGAAYFGMTPEQFIGRNQTELFPQHQEVEEISRIDRLVIDQRRNVDMEEPLTLNDGQVVWLSMIKRPLPQPDGKVHVLGIATDITARKQAEMLAQRFGRLLQSSFNEIYLFDANSLYFLETSEGARKNLGYSDDELRRMTPLDLKPSFTPAGFERLVAPLRSGEQPSLLFETFHRRKDGTTYPVEVRLQLMQGEPPVFLAIILDISERLRLEEEAARARANELSRSLADAVGVGLIGLDTMHRVIFANPKAQEILGIAESAMQGKKLDDIVHAMTADGICLTDGTCPAWQAVAAGSGFQADDWSFLRGDGSRFPVSMVVAPVRDNDKISGSVLSFQDVTARKQAEEDIRDSESRYRSLFDNMQDGFAYCRMLFENGQPEDFIYIAVNAAFDRLTGLENVTGRKVSEVIPGLRASNPELFEIYGRVALGGEPERFETYVGELNRWFSVSVYSPKRGYFVATFDNISWRKQAEIALKETERRQAAILDNIPELAWLKDSESRYIAVNEPCALACGMSAAEVVGKTDYDFWPVEIAELYRRDDREVMASRRRKRVEEPLITRDGKDTWIETIKSPIIDGQGRVIGTVGTARDISARRAAEAALTHHMAELARVNDELDEFTHVASHDLQEPVRKLVAFSDLLRKDLGGELPLRAAQDLVFIVEAAQRMQRLVQDLLALSRTGNVSMVRAPVALDAAADRALEVLELRIAESGATISRVPLPTVLGDLTLLSQLYQNLIGNALKFVDGKRPEISLTAEQIDGVWVLGVRDNGIGIDPQYRDRVFQPFKRLHGRGQYEGSGIGLSICRKVVERHNGRIWVESEEGKGAHFKFTLGETGG
ncbi:MAG: PAS domain S-box protein [Sulfuricellaceae bacterium]